MNLPQPERDTDINEYHLAFCAGGVGAVSVGVSINLIKPNGTPYMSEFTLIGRHKMYDASGAVLRSEAGPIVGQYELLPFGPFTGDIFVDLHSCGKGPSGNYMYQLEDEIYVSGGGPGPGPGPGP